jgi:EAL domain-containing protein (putative c-di-GMP-specific phosphodiesterase class I)
MQVLARCQRAHGPRGGSRRELGVGLGIDDFGTGYSSLTYLRRFPVDFVKVDRSFIAGLPDNKDDLAIVKAVISLGRSLGLTTIAEGVETAAQLEQVHALGCDLCQGYHFSRPRPADELSEMFANGALERTD